MLHGVSFDACSMMPFIFILALCGRSSVVVAVVGDDGGSGGVVVGWS